MPDHPVQEFDIWLRNEISLIQLDDSQFSKQVLKKFIQIRQQQPSIGGLFGLGYFAHSRWPACWSNY